MVINLIFYATKLRALAIVGVLLIHISARLVRQEVGSFEWWIGNIVDSSVRWAVPIFFMLSGMLLLGKKEAQSVVIKKRVPRLIWPLLFWSFIYSLWASRYQLHTYSLEQSIINLFNGTIKYHLWYLYTIIGLYLCMPLFKTLIQYGKKVDVRYFICLSFLTSAIFISLSSFLQIKLAGGFEYLLGFGSYFLLGHYLANTDISKRVAYFFYIMGGIALFVTIMGTWLFSLRDGTLNQGFYEYLSLTTPFVAISIFILFKHHGNNLCGRFTTYAAKYSFGVYLIHPIVLDIFRSKEFIQATDISELSTNPIIYIAIILSVVYIFSILLTMFLHRIPYINRLV